jgi:hypothetical protein
VFELYVDDPRCLIILLFFLTFLIFHYFFTIRYVVVSFSFVKAIVIFTFDLRHRFI